VLSFTDRSFVLTERMWSTTWQSRSELWEHASHDDCEKKLGNS